MLGELSDNASSLARNRLTVETLVGDQVPELWFFDRSLVEMAMLNAIHNALAYARSRIRIEADMQDGYLVFTVFDDSNGYPEQILARHRESAAGGQGTGLGLRFAQLIAELHENRPCRHAAAVQRRRRGIQFAAALRFIFSVTPNHFFPVFQP